MYLLNSMVIKKKKEGNFIFNVWNFWNLSDYLLWTFFSFEIDIIEMDHITSFKNSLLITVKFQEIKIWYNYPTRILIVKNEEKILFWMLFR